MMCDAITWNMRMQEPKNLYDMEMRCLRKMCEMIRLDRLRNEELKHIILKENMIHTVDQQNLKWFERVECMGTGPLTKKCRGLPHFIWLYGVKTAWTAKSVQTCL